MKKFFRNDTSVMITEGILGGIILVIELISQITKWIDYRKEKHNNK